MILYYSIEGVGRERVTADATSGELSAEFVGYLSEIQEVWLKKVNDTNYQFTTADYNQIKQAINNMEALAANGFTDSKEHFYRINLNMARHLDVLLKSFAGVGLDAASTVQQKKEVVENWFLATTDKNALDATLSDPATATDNAALVQANSALSGTLDAASTYRSIQAMIELEYVKAGNELIQTELSGLETALGSTEESIEVLTQIQNYYNMVEPQNPGSYEDTMHAANFVRRGGGIGLKLVTSDTESSDKTAYDRWVDGYESIAENGVSNNIDMNEWGVSGTGTVTLNGAILDSLDPVETFPGSGVFVSARQYIVAQFSSIPNPLGGTIDGPGFTAGGSIVSGATSGNLVVDVINDNDFLLNGHTGYNAFQTFLDVDYPEPVDPALFRGFNKPTPVLATFANGEDPDVYLRNLVDGISPGAGDPPGPVGGMQGVIDRVVETNGFIVPDSAEYLALTPAEQLQADQRWEGSLPQKLTEILESMQELATDSPTSWTRLWVQDNIGIAQAQDAAEHGRILSSAQVASQALNDQQKENVRKTLFLFEEFYKSASGMLIKISQLIEKIAQAASR